MIDKEKINASMESVYIYDKLTGAGFPLTEDIMCVDISDLSPDERLAISANQMELEDLHMSEPSETWYKINKHELETKIAMIEDTIDCLEQEQKMMRPFFWTLVGFVIISVGLLIYAYVKSKI